jgi:hypothetical protein
MLLRLRTLSIKVVRPKRIKVDGALSIKVVGHYHIKVVGVKSRALTNASLIAFGGLASLIVLHP